MSKAAKDFIVKAEAEGYKPTLNGEWTKWEPPLPVNLLMECVEIADEIAEELASANNAIS